jgi:conjugal transfer pilus assembly protein TrbC
VLPVPALKPDARLQGVDPEAIASRYRNLAMEGAPREELLVFISTAMPKEALRRLAQQSAKAGGILVLRGFRGGLNKGAMQATLQELQPLVKEGADIQINPEAFSRYDVSAVPTFVLSAQDEGCAANFQCQWRAAKLVGDVSLDYALEQWTKNGGRAGSIAQRYLRKMGKE